MNAWYWIAILNLIGAVPNIVFMIINVNDHGDYYMFLAHAIIFCICCASMVYCVKRGYEK